VALLLPCWQDACYLDGGRPIRRGSDVLVLLVGLHTHGLEMGEEKSRGENMRDWINGYLVGILSADVILFGIGLWQHNGDIMGTSALLVAFIGLAAAKNNSD
jgi:hypothetical protein